MNSITPQPIFTPKELEHNSKLREELFGLVASGDSILFVGSGLSMSVDYPSWDGLLLRLEGLAQRVNNQFTPDNKQRDSSPLDYANKLKDIFDKANEIGTYYNELTKIFSAPEQGDSFKEFHKFLVQLPFSLIMTTNYDPVLSNALLKSIEENNEPRRTNLCFAMNAETIPQLSKFLLSLHKTMKSSKQIAHIHGYHDRPKEIILTKQDYEKYYFEIESDSDGNKTQEKVTIHFLVLWSLIATRRIVFFGFGMRDPYLLQLLEDVRKRLWRWDKPTHINVASISTQTASEVKNQAVFLKEKYGVDTYFYMDEDSTHRQLEVLIEELYQFCYPHKKSVSIATILEQGPESSTNLNPDAQKALKEAQGAATGIIPSWISSTNSKLNMGIENENK